MGRLPSVATLASGPYCNSSTSSATGTSTSVIEAVSSFRWRRQPGGGATARRHGNGLDRCGLTRAAPRLGRGPCLLLLAGRRPTGADCGRAGLRPKPGGRSIDGGAAAFGGCGGGAGGLGGGGETATLTTGAPASPAEERKPSNTEQECREHDRGRDDQRLHLPCTSPRTSPLGQGPEPTPIGG